jgi:hypothetical protein
VSAPVTMAMVEAGVQAGFPRTPDLNGYQQEGFGPMDRSVTAPVHRPEPLLLVAVEVGGAREAGLDPGLHHGGKAESRDAGPDPYHGGDGPLSVTTAKPGANPLFAAMDPGLHHGGKERVGAGLRRRHAQGAVAAVIGVGPGARRLLAHQRHVLHPRQRPRLRRLGPAAGPVGLVAVVTLKGPSPP